LLGATDRAIGLVGRFAACFTDGRAQAQVEHCIETMVAQRVFGIGLGSEDLVEYDQLRHHPVLATLAGKLTARCKDCAPLAGKSTLNRLEHAPSETSRYHKIGHDGATIERLFVALFLEAHKTPPRWPPRRAHNPPQPATLTPPPRDRASVIRSVGPTAGHLPRCEKSGLVDRGCDTAGTRRFAANQLARRLAIATAAAAILVERVLLVCCRNPRSCWRPRPWGRQMRARIASTSIAWNSSGNS
jgi:hypothetical protein